MEVTDARLGLGRPIDQVDAADFDLAAGRGEIAGEHLHGGGLTGTVRAEQTQDFAATEL